MYGGIIKWGSGENLTKQDKDSKFPDVTVPYPVIYIEDECPCVEYCNFYFYHIVQYVCNCLCQQ